MWLSGLVLLIFSCIFAIVIVEVYKRKEAKEKIYIIHVIYYIILINNLNIY